MPAPPPWSWPAAATRSMHRTAARPCSGTPRNTLRPRGSAAWSRPSSATPSGSCFRPESSISSSLGVLSWLQEPNAAIKEMARVTRPGGHVLVTSLNSLDLARLLDPLRTPLFAPAKSAARLVAAGLGRLPQGRVRPTRHPSWSVQWRLRRSGLLPIRQTTVGFGPFTYLGKTLLPDTHAIRVEQALQRRADGHGRLLRSTGRLCLVLVRKPDPA